jgi:hypothetical protein
VKDINSQACEQCNGVLERVRTQMQYMTHENFMMYLRFFMVMWNRRVRDRLGH